MTLPNCHRSIPCRASGLVQIAKSLIEVLRSAEWGSSFSTTRLTRPIQLTRRD
jgi:hypothetical protein